MPSCPPNQPVPLTPAEYALVSHYLTLVVLIFCAASTISYMGLQLLWLETLSTAALLKLSERLPAAIRCFANPDDSDADSDAAADLDHLQPLLPGAPPSLLSWFWTSRYSQSDNEENEDNSSALDGTTAAADSVHGDNYHYHYHYHYDNDDDDDDEEYDDYDAGFGYSHRRSRRDSFYDDSGLAAPDHFLHPAAAATVPYTTAPYGSAPYGTMPRHRSRSRSPSSAAAAAPAAPPALLTLTSYLSPVFSDSSDDDASSSGGSTSSSSSDPDRDRDAHRLAQRLHARHGRRRHARRRRHHRRHSRGRRAPAHPDPDACVCGAHGCGAGSAAQAGAYAAGACDCGEAHGADDDAWLGRDASGRDALGRDGPGEFGAERFSDGRFGAGGFVGPAADYDYAAASSEYYHHHHHHQGAAAAHGGVAGLSDEALSTAVAFAHGMALYRPVAVRATSAHDDVPGLCIACGACIESDEDEMQRGETADEEEEEV